MSVFWQLHRWRKMLSWSTTFYFKLIFQYLMTRDRHFWQFLISIIDRFQKWLIEYSVGGALLSWSIIAVTAEYSSTQSLLHIPINDTLMCFMVFWCWSPKIKCFIWLFCFKMCLFIVIISIFILAFHQLTKPSISFTNLNLETKMSCFFSVCLFLVGWLVGWLSFVLLGFFALGLV